MIRADNDINRHVGYKIRQARKEKDLTQKDLGELMKFNHQMITFYERGKAEMNVVLLYKIAKTLNKPIEYFFQEYEENK